MDSEVVDVNKLMGAYLPQINQTLEKWVPRVFTSENVEQIFGNTRYSYDVKALNQVIAQPIWDLLDRGIETHVRTISITLIRTSAVTTSTHTHTHIHAHGPARAQSLSTRTCTGGKRWRSTLLLLIAEVLKHKAEDVLDFVVITEVVHNGTLIIDDIEDNSDYRRGKLCLHKTAGVDVAINAGNSTYTCVFCECE